MASDKSSSSSIPIPFRSKKNLHSNSKPLLSDQQSLSSKTPEKPPQLPSRTRNRKVALSLKEVRRAALSIHESKTQLPSDRTDVSQSVRRKQIDLRPHGNSSRSKAVIDGTEKIPEKFEILCEFFDSLDCAMRLLRLKGVASNFSNICPKIECLTDRRFSYGHLAQLKFILPEAIEFKKILVFDERTSCMKPDLHISLNFNMSDIQGNHKTGSQSMHLRKIFRTRLSEFVNSHPEIDEVPKDLMLPEPFNLSSQDFSSRSSSPLSAVKISIEQPAIISSTNVAEGLVLLNHSEESQDLLMNATPNSIATNVTGPSKLIGGASHFSKSFSRHFFQKVVKRREAEGTFCQAQSSSHSDAKTEFCDTLSSSSMASSPIKLPTNFTSDSTNEDEPSAAITNDCDSTPAKLVSTPLRLMSSTPAMPPPKRSSMSLDDDDSTCSTNKLVRRPPRSRSLNFDDTPETKEEKKNGDEKIDGTVGASLSLHDDILDVLSQSLVQSIREKEKKVKEEQMPAISEAKRRRKMIASLPKLFNAIFFLFHKRTVITKEGLIHKLIAGDLSIVDRREVEEQLDLMMELVPEWISEKLTSSGDLLLCIDKLYSAEMVRARLEGAK